MPEVSLVVPSSCPQVGAVRNALLNPHWIKINRPTYKHSHAVQPACLPYCLLTGGRCMTLHDTLRCRSALQRSWPTLGCCRWVSVYGCVCMWMCVCMCVCVCARVFLCRQEWDTFNFCLCIEEASLLHLFWSSTQSQNFTLWFIAMFSPPHTWRRVRTGSCTNIRKVTFH